MDRGTREEDRSPVTMQYLHVTASAALGDDVVVLGGGKRKQKADPLWDDKQERQRQRLVRFYLIAALVHA